MNILITSAGKRCQLIECLRSDARALGITTHILAADLDPNASPACQLADRAIPVPSCTDPRYAQALLDICKSHSINLVIPTIDTELQVLAQAKQKFERQGVAIAISTPAAVRLSQDKWSTCNAMSALGVPTPRTCLHVDFDPADPRWRYPLIFKPNSGSNSKGLMWAKNREEVPSIPQGTDYLVQECIPGCEYTTNCYFRIDGTLLAAVPHQRLEVRGGEVSKAVTRRVPALEKIASRIEAANAGWSGPICFQTIELAGIHYLIEINARFGGGYPIAHRAGAPFTKWLLQEASGEVPFVSAQWKEGVVMLRFDSAVYLND